MHILKKLICFTICLVTLSACGKSSKNMSIYTPAQIAAAVLNSQDYEQSFSLAQRGDEDYDIYVEGCYAIPEDYIRNGAVCYLGGAEAAEVAILVVDDEDHMGEVQTHLADYLQTRADEFAGYAPDQADLVKHGLVETVGCYAALLICEDPDAARDVFLDCFGPDANQPLQYEFSIMSNDDSTWGDGVYDQEAIVEAYLSGDPSTLSVRDLVIYEKACEVIAAAVTDDMAAWEKALAIHNWLVYNVDYDPDGLSSYHPDAAVDPDSSIPYGPLVNGKGICEGYSSTYQLMMEMLGIDCIVVNGTANGGQPHSWNKVKLDDGAWYCVDVTWDDPAGGSPSSYYFCRSDEFFAETGREWDESEPAADADGQYDWEQIQLLLEEETSV